MVQDLNPVPDEVVNAFLAQLGAAMQLEDDEAVEELDHWLKNELELLPDWPGADITLGHVLHEAIRRVRKHGREIRETSLDPSDAQSRKLMNDRRSSILNALAKDLKVRM